MSNFANFGERETFLQKTLTLFLDAIARPKHQEEAKTTTKLNLKWVKLPAFQIQIHQMHCSFTH